MRIHMDPDPKHWSNQKKTRRYINKGSSRHSGAPDKSWERSRGEGPFVFQAHYSGQAYRLFHFGLNNDIKIINLNFNESEAQNSTASNSHTGSGFGLNAYPDPSLYLNAYLN